VESSLATEEPLASAFDASGESGQQHGSCVSFGHSHDAVQECNAFHERTGRIIKLLTVQEILDEEFVQKM